jgi:hypothetical protein
MKQTNLLGQRAGFVALGGMLLASCAVQKTHPNIVYVFPDQFRNCAQFILERP